MKRTAFNNARGFSTLQLVITIAVMMVVTGFAVVSISRARDHVRLMNSARQFAAYVERARADAVRRHNNATVAVIDNDTYAVTMDWDGFGTTRIQNFDLERGIVFTPGMVGKSVTFNWRGRIPGEESFGFSNGRNTVSVGVSGSGDVTFDAQFFSDATLPPVTLNDGNPGGVMREPGASPEASPSPGASPAPSPGQSPSPSPSVNPSPGVSPNPSPQVSPSPSPAISPSPDASPNPSPDPSPAVCLITANPSSLSIISDGSATVSVNRTNVTGAGTISATSSNSGQIQVTPSSRTVDGTAAGSFTITVKKQSGSVTFSSSGCTSKTVDITVP
jgi:hypothetical protein